MASLLGAGQPKVIPEFTGLQVNTSVQVLPIPIIYGSPRISMNVIYYNGFRAELDDTSSGKGILTGGKGQKVVNYYATFIGALGEGSGGLGSILIIYQDQQVWTPSTYPTNGAYYFNGTNIQTPWSYVESLWPNDARGYKDTAYYAFSNAQIDSSATIPQIDLVLSGAFAGTSPLNNSTITITSGEYNPDGSPASFLGDISLGDADADPALVIYDYLTNQIYSPNFPANFINTQTLFTSLNGFNSAIGDSALSTYCQAVGFAWSVIINNTESANSILARWCQNLGVAPVWDGLLLNFIPYWDQQAEANPGFDTANPADIPLKYYTPPLITIIGITLDQILQSKEKGEDPISFMRKNPLEVYNTVRVDFKDRTNFFNDVPATAMDEVHIELYGPRVDNIGLANEFTLAAYANMSATVQLRRNISVVLTYTFRLGPLWGWLTPMLVVQIPDPTNYANTISVRIVSLEDDEDENITVVAENLPLGAQSPTILPMSPTTPPNQGATNVPPASVYAPIVFAPTLAMLTATGFSTPQIVIGVSGGNSPFFQGGLDQNWGGANLWVSLDNSSYELLATLTGPSIIGALTKAVAGYPGVNPDIVDTIYVNLQESQGSLGSVNSIAAGGGHTICFMQDVSGFEIFSYTTATLVGSYTYALTGLYRGLYGTTPRYFGGGSRFLYVGTNANIAETNLPAAYVGHTFWLKCQSFNVYNNATEELSDCVAYMYVATGTTPTGPTAPPSISARYRREGKSQTIETKNKRRRQIRANS